jgi:hypothetical protein
MLVGLLLVSLLVPACTKRDDATSELLGILNRATGSSYRLQYSESTTGQKLVVKTAVEDDLRYQADVTLEGKSVSSEIVRDDARALRFFNYEQASRIYLATVAPVVPAAVPALSPSPSVSPAPAPSATPADVTVTPAVANGGLEQLRSGDWVVDKVGATNLANTSSVSVKAGKDPVVDALTLFRYVQSAINGGGGPSSSAVVKFNPESIDYNPRFDPFQHPDAAHGELRYDVVPPELPPRDTSITSASQLIQGLPGVSYFRHLSVYVRSGLPTRIQESISIERRLSDPQNDLIQRLADVGTKISNTLPLKERATAVLAALKRLEKDRPAATTQEIRPRELRADFTETGGAVKVTLPDGATIGSFGPRFARTQLLSQGSQ